VAALKQEGLLINTIGSNSFRAVTHLDISSAMIEEAGAIFTRVLKAYPPLPCFLPMTISPAGDTS